MKNKFNQAYQLRFKLLYEFIKNPMQVVGLTFAVVLLLFISSATAQDTVTGAFQGDVSNNQTGDPVAGAAVQITNEQTGVVYNLTTDSKGRFYQGLLSPGFYQIRLTISGFRTRLLRREIKVSLTGEVVPVPVSLEPESTPQPSQAVLEEADNIRVEINTTDARRDGSFKEEEIAKLPLGAKALTRSFDELGLLIAGVAPPPQTIGDVAGPGVGPGVGSAGQFAANGLRSRGNNFTVDGSDNNDEDIGVRRQGFVALIPQPLESIKEYQVITLLAPAQFGRNIGAQVNAVSKQGGNKFNGSLYGFFNSNHLNARNFFDMTNGNETFALRSAAGQAVLLDGQPFIVRNQSGGEDSLTFLQGGGTLGGAVVSERLFYFVSGEFQKINATQEKSFVVPTIEQRGAFGTGATGINRDFFSNTPLRATPVNERSTAIFSLFPFPNNSTGVYGANTFTQVLPADGQGVILSGRLDSNFSFGERQQSITGRYNFTDDERNIPSVNEAIFSTITPKIQTHNFSFFLNSQITGSNSDSQIFNQVRFSFGRTRLNFEEMRNTEFQIPSGNFPNVPFLLNAPYRFNTTLPQSGGLPNVTYISTDPRTNTGRPTVESQIGPIGQVIIAGFSPLGVDVYNFPQTRINNTYQLADELTWRFRNHAFVFGADTRRTDLDSDLPRLSRPLVTFNGAPRLIERNGTCQNGGIGDFCFLPANDPFRVIRPEDLATLGAASSFLLTFNVDRPDAKANLRYYQLNFYEQDTWRVRPELSLFYGLRYEYNTPVREVNGLIEQTFDDPRLDLTPGLKNFIGGRTKLYESDLNNFAPRLGIAYSPNLFGSGRVSVFRAGYGIFYDQILGAVVNQSRNVFPTFLTLNLGGSRAGTPILQLFNPGDYTYLATQGVTISQPGTINIFNRQINFEEFLLDFTSSFPNAVTATLPSRQLEMPMAHHYSFVFEQQLNQNFVVSVGYVGTSGRNLLRFTTPNKGAGSIVAPTVFGLNDISAPEVRGLVFSPVRRENSIGAINQFETTARSTYNSLQTELRGRFTDKFNFQLSYVFSEVTDDVSDVFDLAGSYVLPQNSLTFAGESAPANFDVRHRFAYDFNYNFPRFEENTFLRFLTDNLQIAGTGRFHTGQPFTVNSVIDVNLDGNLTDRLNTTNGIEITGDGRQPLRLAATNPFNLLAPFGQDGQIPRNSFRAGNVLELDLSVIKQFVFGSRRLSFRTDIFNIINRANFGVPVRLLEAPGFGHATKTITPGRRIQLALKYEF